MLLCPPFAYHTKTFLQHCRAKRFKMRPMVYQHPLIRGVTKECRLTSNLHAVSSHCACYRNQHWPLSDSLAPTWDLSGNDLHIVRTYLWQDVGRRLEGKKRVFAHHFCPIISIIIQEHGCIDFAENAQVRLVCTMISWTVAFHWRCWWVPQKIAWAYHWYVRINLIRWMQAQAVT